MKLHGNGVVAQSGGPTAVINNSVYGVIREWQKTDGLGTLYGGLHGIKGILQEDFINLSAQQSSVIDGLRYTPGAALGSCRHKLKEEEFPKLLQIFKKRNIRFFFYVGGNDSMDTADKVHRLAMKENYDLKVIGVPKTIDNDLPFTDHCPGYGSAAKYVATTVMETGIDLKDLLTSNRVTILEAMGRNTGWLAAAAALAKRDEDDVPHLIYLPEKPFIRDRFLADVDHCYRKLGHVYVVVSEGVMDEKGGYLFAENTRDAFGHVRLGGIADSLKSLVEQELKLKVRCNVLGTTQRAAMHYASRTDADEAYMVGREAVRLAAQDMSGMMVTLVREDAREYLSTPGCVELRRVANVEKKVPLDWITESGNFVTSQFLDYARPLIEGEIHVPTKNGLPDYVRLRLGEVKAKVS
ncbi:MAG: 6-phosphofructokinase [Bacillota bacterium]